MREGEIFVVAGVSGNGQIELADAIAGLMKPASGAITLNGVDITSYSIRRRNLAGLSYIPEDRHNVGLVMDFTLSDNLALKSYFKEPFSTKGVVQTEAFMKYG